MDLGYTEDGTSHRLEKVHADQNIEDGKKVCEKLFSMMVF